ncbi:MAG: 5-oxoprolinase subunit PxpA [Flavobacteriaceae bacterium]|nr:5-oxoprolinase subunit PxpA [Flavobacteriaceae bacterium]
MAEYKIDINVDVGEGIAHESKLIPIISSCNIACGGHTGDEQSMREAVQLAIKYNTKIGAHPSFPDTNNFGRSIVKLSCTSLYQSIKQQIEDLHGIIREEKGILHHIKPHGALYNLAAKDQSTAEVIVAVIKRCNQPLKLYVPYGSVIAKIAQKENVKITYEAFADRNYNEDLSLVSRAQPKALITKSDAIFAHVNYMITNHKVKTISAKEVAIKADTFCLHGDTPNALHLTRDLIKNLNAIGIKIE